MPSNYLPHLYTLTNASSMGGDIEWYTEQARSAGPPILEIGAGTGRTLLPLARAGLRVHGLEYDEGMLSWLQEHIRAHEPDPISARVTLHQGDMRGFDLGERFAAIQLPFRALLHCRGRGEQLAALRCCRRHLRPGGPLLLNVFHPSLTYMSANHGPLAGAWKLTSEVDHPDGGTLVVSEAIRYDTPRQQLSARLRYEHFDARGRLVDTFYQKLELAYLYPGDVRERLTCRRLRRRRDLWRLRRAPPEHRWPGDGRARPRPLLLLRRRRRTTDDDDDGEAPR